MSRIENVPLASIDANPMRRLTDYPFNEDKVEMLKRSIEDVGLWEGIIGREVGDRVQIAFGHHRLEAGRRSGMAEIPIIIRDLTDEQMLQFMGHENLEDYNADFLVMLETWEAAWEYTTPRDRARFPQVIETARLLGWIRPDTSKSRKTEGHRLNKTAEACDAAAKLIQGGYLNRAELQGITVHAVREICGRIVAHHEMLESMAKKTGRPEKEVEKAKKVSAKAGSHVAKSVKAGKTAQKDIRGAIDSAAYGYSREAKKKSPLFAMFGKSLADSIAKIAKEDMVAERLTEVKKALGHIEMDDDLEIVKRLALECGHASKRFDKWKTVFDNPQTKVVPLKAIGGGDAS